MWIVLLEVTLVPVANTKFKMYFMILKPKEKPLLTFLKPS
jgi:hypothetical protein